MVHLASSAIPTLPHFSNAKRDAAEWVKRSRFEHARHGHWELARRYAALASYFEGQGLITPCGKRELASAYGEGLACRVRRLFKGQ